MKRFVDRLEGGYRVVRIRRMRRIVYAILALITIFFLAAVAAGNGASLRPFYLPLDIVLGVALVMGLVWLFLSFVFRNLRIRYAARSSQKFLMAGNSIRRALILTVVAIIVGVLFVMPFFHSATEDHLSSEMTVTVFAGTERGVSLWNTDGLGLTETRQVTIHVLGSDVNVCFMEGDYDSGSPCPPSEWQLVDNVQPKSYVLRGDGLRIYSLVLNGTIGSSDVRILSESAISETILGVVPLTMLIIAVLNVVWIAILNPVKKKFAAVSIYSHEYVEKVKKDERFYGAKPAKTAPEPVTVPETVSSVKAEIEAEIPPVKEVERPPPPPPEEEIPPPPELVTVPYLFDMAKDRVSTREFEQAVGFYDDILEREPDNVAALIGKGTALTSLDREDETIECMQRVLEADPKSKAALLWMAKVFDSRENWDEALKWYDRYLGIYHGDEKHWIKHGDVLVNLGRGDIAMESYRNALKINPHNQDATRKLEKLKISVKDLMTRALSRSALGNYLGALEVFDRVLRIEPGNTKALLGKGVAYRRLNKINSAVECLNAVLEMDPENQAALLNKGGLLEGQERWQEALYCYNLLVKMNPKDDEAWVKKGDVHLNLGMKDEALESYGEAIALDPEKEDVVQRRMALEGELAETTEEKDAVERLSKIKGVTKRRATLLYEAGFRTVEDLSEASTNKLKAIQGISRKTARMILESVRAEAEEFDKRLNEIPGVGPSLAKAILDAGYASVDQIMSASPKKLSEIKGISKKKAESIIDFLSQ
ncbi:MAG: tetratricopeptide repeat protein [Thermoplasmata archaeon]|nr:tetratricopeptide repeat protein [Thermoplasmata archaeon]